MIAKLTGKLDTVGEDWIILDVGGVGYLVFCSVRTLRSLPEKGGIVSLHIETNVREDHIHLYGFESVAARSWFTLLQTVQGVGAKVALGILSLYSGDELTQIVAAQDKTALTRVSGVGPKVAGRITAELKDKVAKMDLGPVAFNAEVSSAAGAPKAQQTAAGDAVSALVNLGYGRADAFGAVAAAARTLGPEASVEALITAGLKELAA
ncbi:Holliday junction branch migration protein RuvA [Sneathiella chungangensis]|uniref:Holliday junction branch migration complex subunit RuvA n=1 Tax=Sneathiella chungangensis TaxID=1418234 RepID=A0A845MFS2_9PROT|nr:Holliday junction branch migration protein RuvA [Sneathiella chungangensis]MZR22097.1 Holliday junction branch migration protein RuvA [Sneathiella chungangensis]